ncbi:MAG TPA: cupin domain-containing protein [Xanthobacteraceae bacterium]|nr:cupin domain-containing protein [Xanthobacteraceae bacterium]
MTADEVIALLDLTPGATCGFVRLTYVAGERIAPGGLSAPFESGRPMGSALYFLVTPQAPVQLHRIRNDQLYHYYLGDPLDVLLMREDGSVERVVVGPDLAAGQRVQLYIPGGTFHTARLLAGGGWFLGASTEWPGVEPEDVELGEEEALVARFPAAAAEIRSFPVPLAPQAGPVVLPPTGARST